MKQSITFVHPTLFKRRDVRVGPDHFLMVAGTVAGLVRLGEWLSGVEFAWYWYAGAAVVAHARHWRHILSVPVLGSLAVAVSSFGISNLVAGIGINRWVAMSYRDAGWKIRNTDGELGEYSSRFLAVDCLGFHESDLMGVTAGAQRGAAFRPTTDIERPSSTEWADTIPQARRESSEGAVRPVTGGLAPLRPILGSQRQAVPETAMG